MHFQQSDVDEDSGDEDDDNSSNDVFGITTVINLTDKQVGLYYHIMLMQDQNQVSRRIEIKFPILFQQMLLLGVVHFF